LALNLGELHAVIDADDRGFNRGIDAAGAKMAQFHRDTNGRLHDMQGRFVAEGEAMGRGLSPVHRALIAVHDRMDRVTQKFGGMRGILRGLAGGTVLTGIATGAAGAASALGPVLSLVSTLVTTAAGLGAALPGALLAGAAAAGTLKIGLTGVGDAIAGDEEALERLPGPARDFVGVVRDLKDDWDDLTKSVQSRLFKGTAGDLKDTAEVLLPRLKTGLGQVAEGWNDMFRAALQSAKTPRFIAGISDVLESTGRALSGASTGLDGWARGLGILFSAVAPLLERIGDAAGRLGDRFGEWMEQARASGALQRTLDTMVSTLGILFGIVQNVGGIFQSVFSAANTEGGGLLGVIESLTGQLSDFFKSAEGQDALTSFFGSLKSVADAVVPIVLALAEAFALHVAPIFATIAEEAGPTLRDLVERIGEAIGKIDAEELAQGFTDVLDAVLPLVGPLGDFVGWVSSIEGLVPLIVIALAAWTVAQWALNVAMWANPIGLIILAIGALIAIVWLIVANWDTITHVLATNWEWLKGKTSEVWDSIKEFFIGVWNAIKDFFVGVWTAIKDFFVGIWNSITGFVETKVDQLMLAIGFLGSLPGKVAGWFGGVLSAAKEKLNSLVDWVKGIPDRVLGALGDLGNLLKDAGRDILQGLLDGIESMWGSVQNKLSDLTGMIPDWKGPEDTDKKLLTPAGKFIIGGLIEGIDSMIPQVQATLQGLTTDIGLQVDAAAAPAAAAAPVINVAAPTGPDEYVVAVPIDLGEGITEVVEIKMRRRDADLKRRALAGTGRAR